MQDIKIEKKMIDDDLKVRKFILIPQKRIIGYKGFAKYAMRDFEELVEDLRWNNWYYLKTKKKLVRNP